VTPSDLKFALLVAPRTCEWMLRNLRSLVIDGRREAWMPHLDRASAPAVLIVGAGPTLDLDRVRAAHDAGVSIWTVNNAARAVCSVVSPDVVVVRESLDVSPQLDDLDHRPKLVAVDLVAHPNVWTKALAQGPAAFFIAAMPSTFAVAAMLDVAPVYAGSASLTAAVAMAASGGAQWIGLEGVDLAYARDGRGYAPGARYQATLAGVDGGGLGRLAGGDEQEALAASSGQDGPPKVQHMIRVHARDGGEHLYAQRPWVDQIEWLETFAARRGGQRPVLVRGDGLADLVGWHPTNRTWEGAKAWSLLVQDAHEDPGFEADASPVDPDRLTAVLTDIDRQIACQRAISEACTAGEDPTKILDLVEGSTICDVHSAGTREVASRTHPSGVESLTACYREYIASVERLSEVR
jgi:hypothetical protein